jgi:type II restriction/modification system DNA methylase subunit YeeA
MNYFCNRLSETGDFTLEDMENIFSEIIEELPIMRANIYGDEFVIKYNRWVDIKLTDTTKQIYRDIKLEKIFNKL